MFRARTAGPPASVDTTGRPVAVSRRQGRTHAAGARGANLLARIIHLVVTVIVAVIVAGILLVVLKANPGNSIVSDVHDWARSLAGPFDGIFSFHDAHVAIAVNWGIAAAVYAVVGGLIARLLGSRR